MLENLARLSNILGTTYEESRSYKDNDRSDKCKIVTIIKKILVAIITIAI